MILVLVPEDGRTLRVLLVVEGSGKGFLTYTKVAPSHSSWLSIIHEALESFHTSLKDITGIAVLGGVSSFTGSRVAFTIGNTLSYALSVPVCSLVQEELVPSIIVTKMKEKAPKVYAIPTYSGEPNIGHKNP